MLSWLLARSAFAATILMAIGAVALGAPLPAVAATSTSTTVLEQGAGLGASPSAGVRRVQRILDRRGFDLGRPGVDGRFGPLTAAAVRRLQTRYGLVPDGVVGPKTRSVLGLIERASQARRGGAREPRSTPRRPATSPPSATPTTPSTGRPAAPPRGAQPVGPVERTSTNGSDLPIIVAAIALLLAATAVAVALTRRRPEGADGLVAIDRELYLEGESERPDIGSFRGFALATAVPRDAGDDPRRARYLVDDPRKPAPVWVEGGDVRRSPSKLGSGEPVIGYVATVSDPRTDQEAFMDIESACDQAGWRLEEIVRDQDTGRMVGRPGFRSALERIVAGEARALVVSDSRSLVRSLADLSALLEWFRDAEAALVALDLELDTATVHGHQTASTLISVSAWEGERIATRARRSLARVQTPGRAGPTAEDRAILADRIRAMREAGMSLQAIATQLSNEGVPPLRGAARWTPAAVKSAIAAPSRPTSIRDELPAIPGRRGQ